MKKVFFLSVALLVVFTSLSIAGNYKKYADKTGVMTYTASGTTTGEYTYYWDDWGWRELIVEKTMTSAFGMKSENNNFTLSIGKYTYSWKAGDSEIRKMENPILAAFEEDKSKQKDMENAGKEILKTMGFEHKGTQMCEGRKCEYWESPTMGKTWYWKTYSIKSEMTVMGMSVNMVVKDLNAGAAVDAKKFALPKDMKVVDMDAMMNQSGDEGEDGKKPEEADKAAKELMKGLFGK